MSRTLVNLVRANEIYGGRYRIAGSVSELGVVGKYRVRLYIRLTGMFIKETISATDGSYAFNYIAYIPNGYTVIAFDHSDPYHNAAIADLVTPEPMP